MVTVTGGTWGFLRRGHDGRDRETVVTTVIEVENM